MKNMYFCSRKYVDKHKKSTAMSLGEQDKKTQAE